MHVFYLKNIDSQVWMAFSLLHNMSCRSNTHTLHRDRVIFSTPTSWGTIICGRVVSPHPPHRYGGICEKYLDVDYGCTLYWCHYQMECLYGCGEYDIWELYPMLGFCLRLMFILINVHVPAREYQYWILVTHVWFLHFRLYLWRVVLHIHTSRCWRVCVLSQPKINAMDSEWSHQQSVVVIIK